jgi:hypothetical protein
MTDTEKGMIIGIAMQQPFIVGNSVNVNKPVIINDGLKLGIKASCSVNADQETQSLKVGVYMSATCTIKENT